MGINLPQFCTGFLKLQRLGESFLRVSARTRKRWLCISEFTTLRPCLLVAPTTVIKGFSILSMSYSPFTRLSAEVAPRRPRPR
ncbi:hypothetical protein V8H18_11330 [Lautropia mirabilis]